MRLFSLVFFLCAVFLLFKRVFETGDRKNKMFSVLFFFVNFIGFSFDGFFLVCFVYLNGMIHTVVVVVVFLCLCFPRSVAMGFSSSLFV